LFTKIETIIGFLNPGRIVQYPVLILDNWSAAHHILNDDLANIFTETTFTYENNNKHVPSNCRTSSLGKKVWETPYKYIIKILWSSRNSIFSCTIAVELYASYYALQVTTLIVNCITLVIKNLKTILCKILTILLWTLF